MTIVFSDEKPAMSDIRVTVTVIYHHYLIYYDFGNHKFIYFWYLRHKMPLLITKTHLKAIDLLIVCISCCTFHIIRKKSYLNNACLQLSTHFMY